VPDTYIVKTPGGFHLYFLMPTDVVVRNSSNKLGPGIDIRGEGGFVVGPGSPHKNGGVYEVLDDFPLVEAPPWLLELVKAPPAPAPVGGRPSVYVDPMSDEGLRRQAAARAYLASAPPAIQGQNGSGMMFMVACRTVRLGLPLDVCEHLIDEIYSPRCQPPWTQREILHKLESANLSVPVEERGMASETFGEKLFGRVKLPPVPAARRVSTPTHVYSHSNVARPSEETHPITPGGLIADLRTHVDWEGVLQFDVLRKIVVAVDPPMPLDAETSAISDEDYTKIRHWFECHGFKARKLDIVDAVRVVAMETRFHPFVEYLDSLPVLSAAEALEAPALKALAAKGFGDPSSLAQSLVIKTLVAAVRRSRRPGTKVDNVLVLRGFQGQRKSTSIEVLFGKAFTKSQMPALDSKDASLGLRGFVCVELAEVHRVMRSTPETVKEFLSRSVDSYRPPFGREEVQVPRMNIFIGTTNLSEFLEDTTGNRRWWVIESLSCDLDWIDRNRDELWAAASALEASGYPHWLENERDALEAQSPYEESDAWQEVIEEHMAGKTRVTSKEVWLDVLAKGDAGALQKFDKRIQGRITKLLVKMGCLRRKSNGQSWYEVPAEIKERAMTDAESRRRKDGATVLALRKVAQ
jgi:predicted P-loop ATPase